MSNLEKYLEPVSAENPCGQDIDADGSLFELDTLLRGETANEVKEGEEPERITDWTKVREKANELLGRSRHLKPTVVLCLTGLMFDGLVGFRDGLTLLRGTLEKFWDTVYPRLDPQDEDATQRVNLVRNLSAPLGSEGPFRFAKLLLQVPLTNSRLGSYCLEDILASEHPPADAALSGRKIPSPKQIVTAFNDSKPDAVRQTAAALAEVRSSVKSIETLLSEKVGEAEWSGLAELTQTLQSMDDCLARYAPGVANKSTEGAAAVATGEADGSSLTSGARGGAPAGTGAVASREDVAAALDLICDYYRRVEPASPVPFLLRRAKRLIRMDFMQSMNELAPASLDSLKPIFGETGDQSQAVEQAGEAPAGNSDAP